jgi:nucleotide-binding universal stress UspA family protein
MFRRILVPLDGSETAEKVLPVAKAEATSHQATIVLLRVVPPVRGSLMMPPKFMEQIEEQATEITQNYLAGVAEQLRAEGLEVEAEIQAGPPAQQILDYAEENDCDLIIIGTRGETRAVRWRFGSVAFKVVKTRTTMPVLVVST